MSKIPANQLLALVDSSLRGPGEFVSKQTLHALLYNIVDTLVGSLIDPGSPSPNIIDLTSDEVSGVLPFAHLPSGIGVGSDRVKSKVWTVATNGQTVFDLTEAVGQAIELTVDGVEQTYGADYTIAGLVLTWVSPDFSLTAGEELRLDYYPPAT